MVQLTARSPHVDPRPINVLSLCSGAGGLDLGIKLAIRNARTVCYVEIEAYACELLASRMEERRLDQAPIWTDLRTFNGYPWCGIVDLIVAGYPCQPYSRAGKRGGANDSRNLWPHVARVLLETASPSAFFENVSDHLSLGFDLVCKELQSMGYRVEAGLFTALEVGAPHTRKRVFILAHNHLDRLESEWGDTGPDHNPSCWGNTDRRSGEDRYLGDPAAKRLEGWSSDLTQDPNGRIPFPPGPADVMGWQQYLARFPDVEPAVLRSSHGLAHRVDRLRLCGNGVIPEQAAFAFRELSRRIARG